MRRWITILAVLGVGLSAFAQQEKGDSLRYRANVQDGVDTLTYTIPDINKWHPEDVTIDRNSVTPLISMTSLVTGMHRERPERVFVVLPNNTLEVWGRVNVSNGQAQNWGPYPNSYLDARTLSFPVPK